MSYVYSPHYTAWVYYPYPYSAPTYDPPHDRLYMTALRVCNVFCLPPLPNLDALTFEANLRPLAPDCTAVPCWYGRAFGRSMHHVLCPHLWWPQPSHRTDHTSATSRWWISRPHTPLSSPLHPATYQSCPPTYLTYPHLTALQLMPPRSLPLCRLHLLCRPSQMRSCPWLLQHSQL
jgi:hypothetical protein